MQVQQEALTEEEVALLHPVQPVQLCLQPQPNAVLFVSVHCRSGHSIHLLSHTIYSPISNCTALPMCAHDSCCQVLGTVVCRQPDRKKVLLALSLQTTRVR